MFANSKKVFFAATLSLLVCFAFQVKAASPAALDFNVNQNYDATDRSAVPASLVLTTPQFYFYLETDFWNTQTQDQKNALIGSINALSDEFANNIYPGITSLFGQEARPGIDNDTKITVLFESMKEGNGGYFRQNDEYQKLQVPDSNQREMVYLSLGYINQISQLKVILAHEFMHLVIFNQKNNVQGVQEETWLDEARSDYTSTLLGYDDHYEGSNLQSRVNDFLKNPTDSLPEFLNTKSDFASVNIFMHYLVDHYGINVLADSLKSKSVGILSINEALTKNGFKEDFAQIFTNWTIATLINDCSLDVKYCYTNEHLANLKISPNLVFLPLVGGSSLSTNNVTKNWAGNWQKIIGGNGDLTLKFSSAPGIVFKVPYLVYDKNNNYTLNFLAVGPQSKGEIEIKDFGTKYSSLVLIPSAQSKITGFNGPEDSYPYTFTISINQAESSSQPETIQSLKDQIAALKAQIAVLLAEKNQSCKALQSNLSLGTSGAGVTCLQQFLKAQGTDIYPEAMVTGFFGNLTKAAVIRFQKKYGIPQTGFVGILTRTKINTLLTP